MNQSKKYSKQKKSYAYTGHTVWFYLDEILGQARLEWKIQNSVGGE